MGGQEMPFPLAWMSGKVGLRCGSGDGTMNGDRGSWTTCRASNRVY
jgi:hypothetical protein